MAAVQPHTLIPASFTLPIYLFFLRVTCEQKAEYCPQLPSTPIPSLICSSIFIPPSITNPLATAQNSPFPNPTSALVHPGILMQVPTAPWHTRGLRFSDRRPLPFVSRLCEDLNVDEP